MPFPRMKTINIFFSWQSDLEPKETRHIIQDAICKAKKHLQEIVAIEADRDTKGQTGSPNIEEVIFDKIRSCDIFIADVSIVNKYTAQIQSTTDKEDITDVDKTSEREERKELKKHKTRFTPNPNVIEELGFAAAIVGWNNVICIMNTDYGRKEDLPFDLSHHRITDFSLKKEDKTDVIKKLQNIIVSHVFDMLEHGPRQKGTNANHIVGYYDLENRILTESLVAWNACDLPFVEAFINKKRSVIHDLIENIKGMDVPLVIQTVQRKDEQSSLVKDAEFKQKIVIPKISQTDYFKSLYQHFKLVNVEQSDRELIKAYVRKEFNEELDEQFFSLGNLHQNPFYVAGFTNFYEGSLEETKKYDALLQLVEEIIAEQSFIDFLTTFEDVRLYPLAICNKSKNPDQRLTVMMIVENGEVIVPTKDFIADSLKNKYEGKIHDLGFIRGLFELPETGDISDNTEREPVMPHVNGLGVDPYGGYHSAESNEEDYEDELKEYILSPIKGSKEYKINVSSLRPDEKSWLGIIALKDNGSMPVIRYRVWSENTDGSVEGVIR